MRRISEPKVRLVLLIMLSILLVGIGYKNLKREVYERSDIKVSIIVPVYNAEKYIPVCMNSLINQTLRDIEIICIDDGSTDRSGAILDKYAKKDNRIVVIHQNNKGVSAARNRGLDYGPRGEYTAFVDSDDYVEKGTYEYIYNVAKANDDDVVEFGWRYFKMKGKYFRNVIREKSRENKKFMLSEKKDFIEILNYNWSLWNKLYRTESLEQSGVRFMEEVVNGEDLVYNFMIIPYIKKYERVDKIFYNYRETPGGITYKSKNNAGIENCIKAIPAVCNQWREHGLLEGKEDFILDALMAGFWYLIEDTAKQDVSYANRIAESFGEDVYNSNVLTTCSRYTKECVYQLEEYRRSG